MTDERLEELWNLVERYGTGGLRIETVDDILALITAEQSRRAERPTGTISDAKEMMHEISKIVDQYTELQNERRAVQPEEVQRAIEAMQNIREFYTYTDIEAKSVDLAITALRQMQGWIPCSERLPEVGNFVLIYNSYSPEEYETLSIGMIYQPSDGRRKPYWKWLAHRKDSFYSDWICPGEEYITHWMPLPEPPKEET